MAAAYGSIATASATNANAVTVNKPASLALGELMVAIITNGGRNDPATAATSSGWTQLTNTNNTQGSFALDVTVLAKVATSGDVAASNFTFSVTNTTDVVLGTIVRVTGFFSSVAASYVADADSGGVGGTDTYSGGVTPTVSGDVLIIGEASAASNTRTHSGYSVANNNPTWTERADFGTSYNDGSTTDFLYMGVATGTYAAATATGNYSVTNTGSGSDNVHGFLISIHESPISVSVSPAVIGTTITVQAPTVTGGATVSPSVIGLVAGVQAPTVTTAAPDWINPDKPSTPSWDNPLKS